MFIVAIYTDFFTPPDADMSESFGNNFRIFARRQKQRRANYYKQFWTFYKCYSEGELSKEQFNKWAMRGAGLKPKFCNIYISGMTMFIRFDGLLKVAHSISTLYDKK